MCENFNLKWFYLFLIILGNAIQHVGCFPQPGIELMPPAPSPNHWTAREVPWNFLFLIINIIFNNVNKQLIKFLKISDELSQAALTWN